jgi:hypothetical protein
MEIFLHIGFFHEKIHQMEGKLSSQPPTHPELSTKNKIYGLHQGGGMVCTLFEDRFVGKEVGLSIDNPSS